MMRTLFWLFFYLESLWLCGAGGRGILDCRILFVAEYWAQSLFTESRLALL